MRKKTILIADDDSGMRMALSESLERCGYEVTVAENGSEALDMFSRGSSFEAVITDMRMPKTSGMEVLRGVKKISHDTPVIVITAYGTVNTAVEAMKEGASDFLMKPFSLDDLEFVVRNVLADTKEPSAPAKNRRPDAADTGEIISGDPGIHRILNLLKSVAKSKSTILLHGETGTGKELFARFIYRNSTRRNRPFVAVNCAAIPGNLLESEMFGYEKGAFTGAVQKKPGKFELADGGTLLLDEVSEMDMQLQAKLLRVIQESEVDRLGGRFPIPVDVRIIATTNTDLRKLVDEKKFREDLYYRLRVIPVTIPPLRERPGDVLLLAGQFIKKYSQINERPPALLSRAAEEEMGGYPWPGNVRELENAVERAILVCDGGILLPEHFYFERREGEIRMEKAPVSGRRETAGDEAIPTIGEMEKTLIFEALNRSNGNKTQASKLLGISVRTIRNKLHEYGCLNEEGMKD